MLTAALRDLQWRKRRFVIAIVGTGLVFAMTLVLTGLANGFRVEATRTVDSLGVDAFSSRPERRTRSWDRRHSRPPKCRIPGVQVAVPLVYGSATIPIGRHRAQRQRVRCTRARTGYASDESRAGRPRKRTKPRCRTP